MKHNHNQNSEAQLWVCEFRPNAKNRSQVDRCELGKILKEELAKIVQKYSIDYDIDENARCFPKPKDLILTCNKKRREIQDKSPKHVEINLDKNECKNTYDNKTFLRFDHKFKKSRIIGFASDKQLKFN